MILNNFLITTVASVSFLTGIALTAWICESRHAKALKRLSMDTNAYLENETERVKAADKRTTDLAALMSQTGDALAENTKLLRILRNIVDPKSLGHRVRGRADNSSV